MSHDLKQQVDAMHALLEAAALRARTVRVAQEQRRCWRGAKAEVLRIRRAIKLLAPEGARARLLTIIDNK